MNRKITCLPFCCLCLVLAAPAQAEPPSPAGLWDINGKVAITLERGASQRRDRSRTTYHNAQFATTPSNVWKSSEGIEWIDTQPLNSIGAWQQQGGKLRLEYDINALNAGTTTATGTTPSDLILMLESQFAATAVETGELSQFPSAITVTLVSVDDAATLNATGTKLAGLRKMVASIRFHDPAETANSDSRDTAQLTLTTRYKGTRAAAPSACCGAAATDEAKVANLADSQAFLAANRRLPRVKTTPSGLQYKILAPGYGPTPGISSRVFVWYRGQLPNGEVFDGNVIDFPLAGVIGGWMQGLAMMKEGAWYRLYIPPELAYGETGQNAIPPNSALIFDIKLWKINR